MADCNPVFTPVETGTRLKKEGVEEAVDATRYRQLVGSLRFLCNSNTRPDLAYGVGHINKFMERPNTSHYAVAKKILRYIKGTLDFGLLFPSELQTENLEMVGFTDSDWCGDHDNRRSTARYIFQYGNGSISWCCKKQNVVALSSCEAEYIAASLGACQALWLENLMEEMQLNFEKPVKLLIDNRSAINLAKHPAAHGRSKHIET